MLPAYGLYTHVRRNELRSRVLVGILFGLVLVLVYGIDLVVRGASGNLPRGMRPELSSYLSAAAQDLVWLGPLSFVAAFLWLWIAYRVHQAIIDRTVGSAAVGPAEAPRLYRLLENLCISRGIPMPALRIAEDPALNAFATGLNPGQYAVTVTTGLLEALDDREIEAVLAHELTHIRNDDVRTMMIAVVIAGIFAFVAELLLRGGYRPSGNRKGGSVPAVLIGALLIGLVWFLSQLIRFALSRTREYVADAGAVELTKNPDAMITALLKISGRGELAGAPSGVMELCVDNPRSGIADLFATHPSIDDRIAALTRYAAGRAL
ncbi:MULTISPECIES: M48 family metallopeptidase [Methylobacterium]|uniref:Protease HtpX n=4 Tax=Pseudomonadota TaxID=1224 RepID=A0ABQ4SVC2_9HYPH|nr:MULTISPECIES: M48 family metallopeptidase [Methylobacterium]GBU17525.1 endopeptidase [Methylobacterium sp.]GJE07127.1 Protease HtpX [Methylobacterium jeotgali]